MQFLSLLLERKFQETLIGDIRKGMEGSQKYNMISSKLPCWVTKVEFYGVQHARQRYSTQR